MSKEFAHNKNGDLCKKPPSSKKKDKGGMNIIKAALYMLRKKRDTKPSKVAATNTALKRIVGSVRPLHGGDGLPPSPPRLPPPSASPEKQEKPVVEVKSPVYGSYAASCSSSSSSSSSSVRGMSRYASAQSLYDLDNHDDDDDDDDESAYYDGIEGDDMIDAKAEIFIAKFYEQMRLQGHH